MNDKEGEERKDGKQGEREYNDEETRTQNSSLYPRIRDRQWWNRREKIKRRSVAVTKKKITKG